MLPLQEAASYAEALQGISANELRKTFLSRAGPGEGAGLGPDAFAEVVTKVRRPVATRNDTVVERQALYA